MRAVRNDSIDSIRLELRSLEAKIDQLIDQSDLMPKVLESIRSSNEVAAMNNGARAKQLGQINVMVLLIATGVIDLLYKGSNNNAAEVGRFLQLITGYSAEEYGRIIGNGGCNPTKIDFSSGDSPFEQLAKHLEAHNCKKIAQSVRILGSSQE